MELKPSPIKREAETRGVPVHQPEKLRAPEAFALLTSLKPELIVVMAYGQILRKEVIDLPELAIINLHASLLPRHRGASPIQAAIRDGDLETGVTVMHVDVGLDSGDMILAERCPVVPGETGGSLHDKLADVAAIALRRALPLLASGEAPRVPQDDENATYLGKLSRDDGDLDWNKPAVELERLIRAFDPWPGTFTRLGASKLKLFPPAELVTEIDAAPPGTILEANPSGLLIACRTGALRFGEIQLEGRKRLGIEAFLAGSASLLAPGTRLASTVGDPS